MALSDVLMAWKHLLLDKLHLPPPSSARLENYDLILEAYDSFTTRSNAVDLVDILSMYKQLRLADSDPEEPVSPVSKALVAIRMMFIASDGNSCRFRQRSFYLSNDLFDCLAKSQLFGFLSGDLEVSELPHSSAPSTPSGASRPCSSQVGQGRPLWANEGCEVNQIPP